MNVTLSVAPACASNWLPSLEQIKVWLLSAAQTLEASDDGTVSLHVADEQQARELNLEFRARDYATNVLSFPANLPPEISALTEEQPLGEILLCPSVIEAEANAQKKPLADHWAHLIIHGYLHLRGYDHENDSDAQRMEALESQALNSLGLPNPYLIM